VRIRKPSPAMVVALIALVISLGGTSYAALQLPAGSVGAKELKKNSVTSPKVKDGSLLVKDFSSSQRRLLQGPRGPQAGTGPQGPTGPTGDTGPIGPAGPANTVMRRDTTGTDDTNAVVQCGGTDTVGTGKALGGGVSAEPDSPTVPHDATVELSAPANSSGTKAVDGQLPTGWIARMDWLNDSGPTNFTVYVICAAP
jgi:hypothetical protein